MWYKVIHPFNYYATATNTTCVLSSLFKGTDRCLLSSSEYTCNTAYNKIRELSEQDRHWTACLFYSSMKMDKKKCNCTWPVSKIMIVSAQIYTSDLWIIKVAMIDQQ